MASSCSIPGVNKKEDVAPELQHAFTRLDGFQRSFSRLAIPSAVSRQKKVLLTPGPTTL